MILVSTGACFLIAGSERGGGAHLDNIFPDFFPFTYKLFLNIEMDRKMAEAIARKEVFDTVPLYMSKSVKCPNLTHSYPQRG